VLTLLIMLVGYVQEQFQLQETKIGVLKLGPNVYGISNEVPDSCTVKQAAYVVRHGSR
jgi:hypothetical protein